MKKTALNIILLLTSALTFCQKEDPKIGDTIYYSKKIKSLKKNADFFAVINEITNKEGEIYYSMDGYKINKENISSTLNSKYKTTLLNKRSRTGHFIGYHTNGIKSSEGIIKGGKKVGKWTNWYKTGQIREERIYYENKPISNKIRKDPDILNFWNRQGTQILINGNGFFERTYTFKKEKRIREGVYKNGKKNGTFIGYNGDRKFFEENYKNGKLIKGTSWDKKGKKYSYKKNYIGPKYKKGQESLAKFIKENYRIPTYAKQNNIDGKILIDSAVNKDGRISDIKIIKSLCEPCDTEAMGLLKTMKNWKPAVSKGKKIKVKYTLPITYKLD